MKNLITQSLRKQKRFYGVKEAADALGVSTNTLYKYLNTGEMGFKRIGKGRIKIPLSELLPYLSLQNVDIFENGASQVLKTEHVVQKPDKEIDKLAIPEEMGDEFIGTDRRDIAFFRLFKVSFMIGLGLIYLYVHKIRLSPDVFAGEIMPVIIPVMLVFSGVISLVRFIKHPILENWNLEAHIFQAVSLGVLCYVAVVSKDYTLLAFIAAFFIVIVEHIVGGFKVGNIENTFSTRMLKYLLLLAIIGGTLLLLGFGNFSPDILEGLNISINTTVYVIILFLVVIPFLIYLLNPNWKKNRIAYIFILPGGVVLFYLAYILTIDSYCDVAYISYLTGIYLIFLSIWKNLDLKIKYVNMMFLFPLFIWIGLSIVLGLYAINYYQEKQIYKVEMRLETVTQKTIAHIEKLFNRDRPVLTSYASDEGTKTAVTSGDRQSSAEIAKSVYEKAENISRVVIYDSEGIALGVYPRNSMIEGTNFSSREYFYLTKKDYRRYISPVFQGLTGDMVIIQTEPVFYNNIFAGMLGISYKISDISDNIKDVVGEEFEFYAIDQNGRYALSSNENLLGLEADQEIGVADERMVVAQKSISSPVWNITVVSSYRAFFNEVSQVNIIVAIAIIVNSLIGIGLGLILAAKERDVKSFYPHSKSIPEDTRIADAI